MKPVLFFMILFFASLPLCAQQFNSKVSIEPNIIISYDSSKFKIEEHYTNLDMPSDRISFNYVAGIGRQRMIDVIGHDSSYFYSPNLDSAMLSEFREYMKTQKPVINVVEYDKNIRHINGFSCYGIIFSNKNSKNYYCYIIGNRATGNQNMDFRLSSSSPKNLNAEYKIIELFTRGIKFSIAEN